MVVTAVAISVWAVAATAAVRRTLQFRRAPFTSPDSVADARYLTARATSAVVVVVTTVIWCAAVWAWTWRGDRSGRLIRPGRIFGLFLMLAAVLFAITPFTSERVLSCPGPALAKVEQWRNPGWEYICGYNSTSYLAAAAAVFAIGLAVLLVAVRTRPAEQTDEAANRDE